MSLGSSLTSFKQKYYLGIHHQRKIWEGGSLEGVSGRLLIGLHHQDKSGGSTWGLRCSSSQVFAREGLHISL